MSLSLQSILGAEALAAFEAPGAVARGLPAAAYTSEAVFAARERADLCANHGCSPAWRTSWRSRATSCRSPWRASRCCWCATRMSEVRAFHNVCRHRCLKLVEEASNVGPTIQCPYHSWTYRLDGALHIAPYFGGRDPRAVPAGFDRAQHGLVPVRVAAWHDWIFVNLSGEAPPIEDFVAPIQRHLKGIDLTRMRHVVTVDLGEIGANWKLLMENFIEPYHVPFVHATTTEQPLTDHYTLERAGLPGLRCRRLQRRRSGTTRSRRTPDISPSSPTSRSGSTCRTKLACTSTCRSRRTAPTNGAPSTPLGICRYRRNRRRSSRRSGATCTWRTR